MEKVGTSIPKKRCFIELSTKAIRYYMDEIRERKDWWEICEKLRRGIGRNMMKRRR
ncbi:hypothetical protein HRbin02_00684 [Candidatus Calditenuaceae archaeon HR02]|nr:hypothetical protein HRbin02_00684 [Candidatus Calditenuaceae archaeon HR02]